MTELQAAELISIGHKIALSTGIIAKWVFYLAIAMTFWRFIDDWHRRDK